MSSEWALGLAVAVAVSVAWYLRPRRIPKSHGGDRGSLRVTSGVYVEGIGEVAVKKQVSGRKPLGVERT